MGEEFAEWCSGRGFTCGGEYDTAAMHRDFVGAFQGGERFQTGQRKFTGYIKSYAESKGWQYANVRRGGESFFSFQSLSL